MYVPYLTFAPCPLFNFWRQNSVYKAPRFGIVSQGFTEDQDKEKDKDSQDH